MVSDHLPVPHLTTPTLLCREKKWVDLGLSNSVKIYKWVPGNLKFAYSDRNIVIIFFFYSFVNRVLLLTPALVVREENKDEDECNNKENEVIENCVYTSYKIFAC